MCLEYFHSPQRSRTTISGSLIRPREAQDSTAFEPNLSPEVIRLPQHYRVYNQAYPHFITSTIIYWIPVFCRDDYFRILADSLTYCSTNRGLRIHGYVIMANHFHAICSQVDAALSDVVRDMKKYTSRLISAKLEEDGRALWLAPMRKAGAATGGARVWDEAFHPEQIESKPFFEQKLTYLHDNPVRAGYVLDPCDWKYSSARFYYREETSLVPITPVEW